MKFTTLVRLAFMACLLASPVAAQDGRVLNQPSVNWNVYGPGQTHKSRKDNGVQGGGAIRVAIPTKPANAWDIGASTPISEPIHKGDKLMFAFWVRLVSDEPGAKARIAANIQRSTPPYDAIASGEVEFGTEWTLVHITGVADDEYAAGAANAALSIGTGALTLDLGPAFIMTIE